MYMYVQTTNIYLFYFIIYILYLTAFVDVDVFSFTKENYLNL